LHCREGHRKKDEIPQKSFIRKDLEMTFEDFVQMFAKSTGTEQAVTQEPTIIISSKSSMQTNVEMYGWLFAMIVQNPVIIVIVLAALAMVAYFGWWKRRL
jgi:hypothetical protein